MNWIKCTKCRELYPAPDKYAPYPCPKCGKVHTLCIDRWKLAKEWMFKNKGLKK